MIDDISSLCCNIRTFSITVMNSRSSTRLE